MRTILPYLLGALFTCVVVAGWSSAAPPSKDAEGATGLYETRIRGLLMKRCAQCHGPERGQAGLDLTTPEGLRRGAETGPVLSPDQPSESRLYQVIRDRRMPPKGAGKLTRAEIGLILKWMEQGAPLPAAARLNQHDVLPIMRLRCTVCHGNRRQEAGLDLRTVEGMLKGGKSGPAIVAGKPEESLVLKMVRAGKMPPPRQVVSVSVKPMAPEEIDKLERWIAAGAARVEETSTSAEEANDPLVSVADRQFWAFRPPREVKVPRVGRKSGITNPIDAFILRRLKTKRLRFAPVADALTLIRRATFDLTGLPPTPDEVRAFLAEASPDAYERLIDRLLASPRYGERWGRRWLDLAGYSDSEGIQDSDPIRPYAYKYRDYVIRSLNADKPYDRFLLEQIAGDELADYESASVITAEMADNLIATGFLRMVADGTYANITGFAPDRLAVIADEMEVLSSAVMGLTLKCARCHNHKFDPIPQRDYYRLLAIFKGAYDEHDWLKPYAGARPDPVKHNARFLPFVAAQEREAWMAQERRLDAAIDKLKKRSDAKSDEVKAQIKALDGQRRPVPMVRALWDRGEPSPTYVYQRGDYRRAGELVRPGVPSALTDGKTPFEIRPPWPGAKQTGRRLAFAKWLTRPDHPLTARVMVNRLWSHHFGRGIVATTDNFGKAGAPPTHPKLLDWLAREFVRQGWSMKAMHRLMMNSRTYRQSSSITPAMKKRDPGNDLFSRMPLRRLEGESLRDTLLFVSGKLDERRFGPADPLEARGDGLVQARGTDRGWRRSIYITQRRKQPLTLLEAFDLPQMSPNCITRQETTVATQALYLLNNARIAELAGHLAERARSEAGASVKGQIERVYWLVLSRPPTADEQPIALAAVRSLQAQWIASGAADGEAPRKALASYCHTMLNSAALLYVD